MKSKQIGMIFLRSAGITGIIIFLFYRSFVGAIWFPVVCFFEWKRTRKEEKERKQKRLQEEFLHGIRVLNNALQAGLSMENAWIEVEKEIRLLFGDKAELYLELKAMNQQVAHNMPIETLFLEFAYRSQLEDLIQFAELMEFGKRSGSNWRRIIDGTVSRIVEQEEAKKEIEVMVAEKRLEQQVMNLMPLGLLVFLQVSAWDYMAVLYHNWFGIICMTLMLLGYIGAILLSRKILKVQI